MSKFWKATVEEPDFVYEMYIQPESGKAARKSPLASSEQNLLRKRIGVRADQRCVSEGMFSGVDARLSRAGV